MWIVGAPSCTNCRHTCKQKRPQSHQLSWYGTEISDIIESKEEEMSTFQLVVKENWSKTYCSVIPMANYLCQKVDYCVQCLHAQVFSIHSSATCECALHSHLHHAFPVSPKTKCYQKWKCKLEWKDVVPYNKYPLCQELRVGTNADVTYKKYPHEKMRTTLTMHVLC